MTPRVLFVGRSRLNLPLQPWLLKKWDALSRVLDVRVLNAGTGSGDERFVLLPPDATGFYPRLPFAVARELRVFQAGRRDRVGSLRRRCRSCRAARSRARRRSSSSRCTAIPRSFHTRLRLAVASRALAACGCDRARGNSRQADATRALSAFTSSVVEEARGLPATACFPTYSDLEVFAESPPASRSRGTARRLRRRTRGVQEHRRARRSRGAKIVRRVPDATLMIVGSGSRQAVVDRLVADLPDSVRHEPRSWRPGGRGRDGRGAGARACRRGPKGSAASSWRRSRAGRTVVATSAGGIVDIVTDGHDGLLVPPADVSALVDGDRAAARGSRACRAPRAPRRGRRTARGTRRPTTSRRRTGRSSIACSPARADEARLRHADARPRAILRSRRRSSWSTRSRTASTSSLS